MAAAAGKKSKKAKWNPISITSIIAEPTANPTSWAESVEDETENFGYGSRTRAPVVLPSASRAARGGLAVDDESIPKRPPFIAYISNLPYDVDECAITELFTGLKITNLRLPREGDRLKGYGYVDFEDRDSLVSAMNIADVTISGRRIRIEVSTQDNDRRMGRGGRNNDREREYDPERTMGDWRSGPRAMPDRQTGRAPDRDRDPPRDRDRDRDGDSAVDSRPGAWRDGDRPAVEPAPARAPYGGRDSFGRDRDRYGDDRGRERGYGRDGYRPPEREGYGNREGRGFGGRGFGDRDRDRDRDPPPRDDGKPRERPKLNLLPRTVPRETEAPTTPADGAALDDKQTEKAPVKPVPAEKVFGAAKPVDTAAKEREIEERLRKQEEEARKVAEEKDRWGRKNDHSGDRRGGARRDDRGRDSRSYNRDRRDYSKDDKDRDYRDDRDRRDYSKDDRDRRDYRDERDRRDVRDRRDYSKDNKDRRDYRDDRKDYRDDRDRGERDAGRDNSRDRHSGDRDRTPERHDGDNLDDSDQRSLEERDAKLSNYRDEKRRDVSDEKPHDKQNGSARSSRSRDRNDIENNMPKLKEEEKPNFVASNKFSFLEDAGDGESD